MKSFEMHHERHKLSCQPVTCRYLHLEAWQVKMEHIASCSMDPHMQTALWRVRVCVCVCLLQDENDESSKFHPFTQGPYPLSMVLLLACKQSQIFTLHKPLSYHSVCSFKTPQQSERERERERERGGQERMDGWVGHITCRCWDSTAVLKRHRQMAN